MLTHDHECQYCGAIWNHSDVDCSYGNQCECDDCLANPERSDDFAVGDTVKAGLSRAGQVAG
jgi:hypothetical protein